MAVIKQKEKKEIPKSRQAARGILRKNSVNPWLKIHGILRHRNEAKREIPESWKAVKGILKGKKIDPVKWQRKIRKEGEKKLEKLYKIYKSK